MHLKYLAIVHLSSVFNNTYIVYPQMAGMRLYRSELGTSSILLLTLISR